MRCVRALVQKLFRSTKPEKLENHHSLLQRLRCFLLLLSLRPTVAAIVASAVTRIVLTRIALTGPLRKRRDRERTAKGEESSEAKVSNNESGDNLALTVQPTRDAFNPSINYKVLVNSCKY